VVRWTSRSNFRGAEERRSLGTELHVHDHCSRIYYYDRRRWSVEDN
jgi:hypothetical protein